MRHQSQPAAQAKHVGEMTKARARLRAKQQRPPLHTRNIDPSDPDAAPARAQHVGGEVQVRAPPLPAAAQIAVVNRLVEALDQLVEHHAQAAVRDRTELMRDADIRREYLGNCSRTYYWAIAKSPGFPKAIEVSPRIRLRKRAEIERWLAEREETA